MKSILRRIQKLEKQKAEATNSLSFTIHFIDSKMAVTSTLLIRNGEQIWTKAEETL
jgi:hypothetical protein